MARRSLTLDAEQRRQLEAIRDHDARPYMRERAAALLKVADGLSPHWVARHGLLKERDPDTLYHWLDSYAAAGQLMARPACRRRFSP